MSTSGKGSCYSSGQGEPGTGVTGMGRSPQPIALGDLFKSGSLPVRAVWRMAERAPYQSEGRVGCVFF